MKCRICCENDNFDDMGTLNLAYEKALSMESLCFAKMFYLQMPEQVWICPFYALQTLNNGINYVGLEIVFLIVVVCFGIQKYAFDELFIT